MKKRFLSLLLCLAFLLTLTPVVTLADPEYSGNYGSDVHWEFNPGNGCLTITRDEEGPMPDGEAPWLVHKASILSVNMSGDITTIGTNAFEGCTGITSFAVSDKVTNIGMSAFKDCTGLETVNFPASLEIIGKQAFDGCTSLKAINIPNSVTTLGEYAFRNCTGATSLTLGTGFSAIGQYAFQNCTGLTSLVMPDNVTTINKYAFDGCSNLTSVTMPADPAIYPNAFKGCANVSTITLTKGRENRVLSYNDKSVWRNTNVNCQVFLEEGITLIEPEAFRYANKMTAITIPNSVDHIYSNAFDGCTGLKNVYYLGSKAQRDRMTIDGGNDPLTKAKWTYVDVGLEITQQPADVTVKSGEKATFTVKATGQGLSYQWLFLLPGSDEWAEVPAEEGGTKATLTFPTDIMINGLKVKCRVRNAAGRTEESVDATLTVLPNVPEIKTQPKDLTVMNGAKATFTVKATGKNVRYRWYVKPAGEPHFAEVGGDIDGTKATISFVAAMANNGDEFLCEVYNDDGPTISEIATLKVTMIKTQPKSAVKVKSGAVVKLSLKAVGQDLHYAWYARENEDTRWAGVENGPDSPDYTFTASQIMDSWQFRCSILNADGDVLEESAVTTLTVTPVETKITTQPKNVTAKSGATAKFSVKATGPSLTYEWYRVGDPNPIEGATKADYTFTARQDLDGTEYYCKVMSVDRTIESDPATLHVTPVETKITTQPKDVTVKSGAKAKFTLKATGPSLTYAWYKEGEAEPVQVSAKADFTVTATLAMDGTRYYCKVQSVDKTIESDTVTLHVTSTPIEIKTQPVDVIVKAGKTAKFTVKATGPNLKYQWYRWDDWTNEWVVIGKATKATYSIKAVNGMDNTSFRCRVYNGDEEVWSNSATLFLEGYLN